MNFIDHVIKAEELLDACNGEWGYENALCLFCHSTTYDTKQGLVHSDVCPITQLRKTIKKEKEAQS